MNLPVELDRDEARELAERELAHPRYDSDPPLLQQAVEWLLGKLSELLSAAAGMLGSLAGLVLLGVIAVLVAALFWFYSPPARRRRSLAGAVLGGARRTAREYRAAADAAVTAGRWSEAVVERFRAIIVTLDERAIIDVHPGMTADEAAMAGGHALPDLALEFPPAATLFDAVLYGGHEATRQDDQRLRALDDAVRGKPSSYLRVRAG